jgi:predicted ATPase
MTLSTQIAEIASRPEIGLDLGVYREGVLTDIVTPIEQYLAEPAPAQEKRGLFGLGRRTEERRRVSPLLLTGPVGTGKTTLMMLLDRAIGEASCAPLFQQAIEGHPSTAEKGNPATMIEVHPLALMGRKHNIPTGVIRLRELQTFYRLFTYDRRTATVDNGAAQRFTQFFQKHIVFIDEFVPDVVTSFPMQVINHLADHGVLVVLTSNRKETPFVPGVQIVRVEGEDMRTGTLSEVVRPAGTDSRFDAFADITPTKFDFVAAGLQGRLDSRDGKQWLYLKYHDMARVPADWAAFQKLLHYTEGILIDEVPLFDSVEAGGMDGARRFVFLIDALYDERRPVLVRLTNRDPLSERFEVETLKGAYLPEVLLDLERALSRLRQLSAIGT